MIKSSPCRSRAEKINNCDTLCDTLFTKVAENKGFRPYTETQKSHRQGGGICSPLFVLGRLTKGFKGIYIFKIRVLENNMI